MTRNVDAPPATVVFEFKPRDHLGAQAQLTDFIQWARQTLPKGIPNRVHASIRWEDESWHQHGVSSCTFAALGSIRGAPKTMQPPFADFAKAIVVHRRVYAQKKSVRDWLAALRALEIALIDLTGTRDVTLVSAAICNRACEHLSRQWKKGNNAYACGKSLEKMISLMRTKKLLKSDFRWASPLIRNSAGTLKQQRADREQKLPNPEAIRALGELFTNDLTLPVDIVVTSSCALLLSVPSRVGELADLEVDCVVFKEDANHNRRMFLRWYEEKINQVTLKPVIKPEMESVVERALMLLKPITEKARAYAAWLEDNPEEFPPHERLPTKCPDEPLTFVEICNALKIRVSGRQSPRSRFKNQFLKALQRRVLSPSAQAILVEICDGWDTSGGKRIYVKDKHGLQGVEFDDRFVITLRKLNALMRAKYLPKDFPYTTPYTEGKARVKYRNALFTVRTGALAEGSDNVTGVTHGFGVEIAAHTKRITVQLGGSEAHKRYNIFQRHGYHGIRVNTHAFRHELNTRMHQAGLSQLLIDAFSGRTTMGSVYNHETVEEKTQRVAAYHPKTKSSNAEQCLAKVKTNKPLSLSDVRILNESEQDRLIHQTHVGICVHNFATEPCPKMGACLTCGLLGCVKGDDAKLANLKEEREVLKRRYSNAVDAQSREIFGASEWVKKEGIKLYKCDALIRTLENPELENGDIVWNVDNGWTLTSNAAAMAGLIDDKVIQSKNEKQELPSLEELSAILDEIEV